MPSFFADDAPYSANLDIINLGLEAHPDFDPDNGRGHHVAAVSDPIHENDGSIAVEKAHRANAAAVKSNGRQHTHTPPQPHPNPHPHPHGYHHPHHHHPQQQPGSRFLHESSDESSNSSAHASELSEGAPASSCNGEAGPRPASMNSFAGPASSFAAGDHRLPKVNGVSKPSRMVQPLSPPPPTSPPPPPPVRDVRPVNGTGTGVGVGGEEGGYFNTPLGGPRTDHGLLLSPADDGLRHERLPPGPAPDNTEPDPYTPSIFSTPTMSEHGRMRSSQPSRLSAGSVYATPVGSPPPPPSTPGLLAAGLRQRQQHQHQPLEVPRNSPLPDGPRGSRDGNTTATTTTDASSAFASGRFSPTSAGPSGSGIGGSGGRRSSVNLGRRNTRSGGQVEGPRDGAVPDEDARRWAEAYRHKMANKRRKREEDDDDRVLVGIKVDEHHANWVTAYNMLTGIRVSVSRTNAKLDRPLTDADFEAKQKSTFDIAGNEMVPSAKYDFKFKDYAPWVFRHLRALFQLDPADYLMSLTGKYILSELGSPGKSGSFFYFSRDYKYIIKTIHHAEHKFLRKVLKKYYRHVTDNPNTLLSQFYGLHRVKIPYGKKIHFVVMNNLFPPHRDVHQTFDLKGSTLGREYREDEDGGRDGGGAAAENSHATLKDLNWLRRSRHLELGLRKKQLFLDQLERDVGLLKSLDIMDYSLLVGIHDLRKGNDEKLRDKTLRVFNPGGERVPDEDHHAAGSGSSSHHPSVLLRTPSKLESARKAKELRHMIQQERPVPMGQTPDRMPDELEGGNEHQSLFCQDEGGFRATHEDNSPADEVYYLGVIDCLTHYGIIKKIEHFWKGLSHERSQISALPPDQYGDRFYRFIEGITLSAEEVAREKSRKEAESAAAAGAETERPGSRRASATGWRSGPSDSSGRLPDTAAPMTTDGATSRAESEEVHAPERTRAAIAVPAEKRGSSHVDPMMMLPVVEESAGEASSTGTGGGGRRSDRDAGEPRPTTPAGPVLDRLAPSLSSRGGGGGGPPPTPPKTGYLKPESADSGYGGNGNGTGNGHGNGRGNDTGGNGYSRAAAEGFSPPQRVRPRLSMESLNKDLPPLPTMNEKAAAGHDVGVFRTGVA